MVHISGSTIKPLISFKKILDIFVKKISTLLDLPVIDLVYSVETRKKKKGCSYFEQEDILRPAEPQAISCVLAVRQYG